MSEMMRKLIEARGEPARLEKMAPILNRIPERWGKSLPEVGWDNLLLELDEKLSKLDPDYVICQAKQKFGELRFYTEFSDNFSGRKDTADISTEFDRLVNLAEQMSVTLCEYCGEPGQNRGGGGIMILCDEHVK